MSNLKPIYKLILCCACVTSLLSCSKFLEEKSNTALLIPNSLKDLQALLDNNTTLNTSVGPGLVELITDDYFVNEAAYNNLSEFERQNYIWDGNPEYLLPQVMEEWKNPYLTIFYGNMVLERLLKIEEKGNPNYDYIKGSALFFRAYTYFQMAQVYCSDYRIRDENHNNSSFGLPLRLNTDFEEKSKRSTLNETYFQILKDLEEASNLLPESVSSVTRPSKSAAFAMLARVYLSMERYDDALSAANRALEKNNFLLDYKDLDKNSSTPFEAMNKETIFFAYSTSLNVLDPSTVNVDSILYRSYSNDDLRKYLFFNKKDDGEYDFKGNYAGYYNSSFFNGLAVDELYLIKSECLARNNKILESKKTLESLLNKRYASQYTFPENILSKDEVLRYVLQERRKQLLFRGVRWSDLRRLNKDKRFQKVLIRKVKTEGQAKVYTLPIDDLRFTLLLPQDVIRITGIEQNPR